MSTLAAPAATARGRVRWTHLAAGFGAAAAAVVIVARLVDGSRLLSALEALGSRPILLAVFFLSYTAAFGLRAAAWRTLAPGSDPRSLFGILQVANLANHVLPFKAGELVRPALAARREMSAGAALSTSVLARWLDVTALLTLVGATVPAATGAWPNAAALAVLGLLTAAAAGMLVWLRRRVRGEASLPSWLPGPLPRLLHQSAEALRAVSPGRLLTAAASTLLSWPLEAGAVMVAAAALGAPLTPLQAVAVTVFTVLFQAFHVTPGGIGVYEASMTGALAAAGVPLESGLALAVIAHGLKFGYAFAVGALFAVVEALPRARRSGAGAGAHTAEPEPAREARGFSPASGFEMIAARLWNVVNEGKPFTPVFVTGVILLLSLLHAAEPGYWLRAGGAALALVPLALLFYRFDFPLRLRTALWAALALYFVFFRYVDWAAVATVLVLYFGFTVILWGTIYYHLRMGMPLTNFTRFWRLVLENPDPTSGNFLEQAPKTLLLVLLFRYLVQDLTWSAVIGVEAFTAALGIAAVLIHQWFFTWAPPAPQTPTRLRSDGRPISRRFIAIVIDGCRLDKLREAHTPCIDRLRQEGTEFLDVRTVYPARSVVCFSSMLTGAPPRVHGIRSNFVPRLGVRSDSIFTALRRAGKRGVLVGIAHLVDAFGEEDVRTVTSVCHNDEIDQTLVARAKRVLEEEDPDLLVLQLLCVDQTGHARGSYNQEYLEKIEAADRVIEEFLGWCAERGYLDDATVMINADHGQGIGIGGHGHLTPTELYVPCILWGKGVPAGVRRSDTRSIMDVAPTIAYFLGVQPPEQAVGQVVLEPGPEPRERVRDEDRPVAVILPARNEARTVADVLRGIPRERVPGLQVIVVDDGSTDGTGHVARRHGADHVIRHERNRGLGAALRSGLAHARAIDARAAVYLDADGEYDPREIPRLLEPVLRGEADYVLGSRYLGTRDGQPWPRLVANLLFTALLCVLAGRRITDGQTGFRAFSRQALEVAEIIHDYNYAQVLTLDLLRKGMRMKEVPIRYRYRGHGRSFIRAEYLWRVPWAMLREVLGD
ncbi:MAG TPA: lysylphosphatidylglycerol synthase domain-containing protein [Bacillota bacterium]